MKAVAAADENTIGTLCPPAEKAYWTESCWERAALAGPCRTILHPWHLHTGCTQPALHCMFPWSGMLLRRSSCTPGTCALAAPSLPCTAGCPGPGGRCADARCCEGLLSMAACRRGRHPGQHLHRGLRGHRGAPACPAHALGMLLESPADCTSQFTRCCQLRWLCKARGGRWRLPASVSTLLPPAAQPPRARSLCRASASPSTCTWGAASPHTRASPVQPGLRLRCCLVTRL